MRLPGRPEGRIHRNAMHGGCLMSPSRRGACHALHRHHVLTEGYTLVLFDGYPTGGFDPGCEGTKASAAVPSVFSGLLFAGPSAGWADR